jgi:hypothetical protein
LKNNHQIVAEDQEPQEEDNIRRERKRLINKKKSDKAK